VVAGVAVVCVEPEGKRWFVVVEMDPGDQEDQSKSDRRAKDGALQRNRRAFFQRALQHRVARQKPLSTEVVARCCGPSSLVTLLMIQRVVNEDAAVHRDDTDPHATQHRRLLLLLLVLASTGRIPARLGQSFHPRRLFTWVSLLEAPLRSKQPGSRAQTRGLGLNSECY